MSNSRDLWSRPRLGIGPRTRFFFACSGQNYACIIDLEKKLGVLLTGEGEGVSPLTTNIR